MIDDEDDEGWPVDDGAGRSPEVGSSGPPPGDDEGWPADDDAAFPDEVEDADQAAMAALLAGAGGAVPEDPETGTEVSGRVVGIGPEEVFVDIAAKSEAAIARAELLDDDGELRVAVGDTVTATVVGTQGGIRLARKIGRDSRLERQAIDEAMDSGLPIEGRVEEARKGGFQVMLAGHTRAFCPISQIADRYVEDADAFVGQSYEFVVTERRGRDVVVSRRRLLEAERIERAAETRKRVVPGAVLAGEVVTLMPYGAFIDLGGLQGLLHVSQMSHARVADPAEVVAVGDQVTVQVLDVDPVKGKVSLGMKQLAPDPWEHVDSLLATGERHDGKIVRVVDFGAFVEVAPGLEGLLHVSELAPGRRGADARKLCSAGTSVRVEVRSIDPGRRRISLARVEADDPEGPVEVEVGDLLTVWVERVDRHGLRVRLGPGVSGFLPNAEMGTPPGTDHGRDFGPGTTLEVEVVAAAEGGRDIRLSRARALARAERVRVDAYQKAVEETRSEGGGFSNLGDALRGALAKRKQP